MAGVVSTYTNNLTWIAAPTDSSEWRAVTWGGTVGNKKFVAVTGTAVTRPSRVAVSSDGYEWTTTVQPPQITFSNQCNKIIYDSVYKRYFAAGNGAVSPGSNTLTFSTSSTGLAWVGLGKTMFSTSGLGMASNNKSLRLVAVGSGTNSIAYSDAGTLDTWTGVTGTSIFVQGNRALWYGIKNLWIAVGQGTNTIATSPDGITWTGRGTTVFSISGNCIAFNPTKAVAMGQGTNTIAYSINGTNWYGVGSTIFTTSGNSVAWTGSIWIGAGQGTNTLAYSTNGIVWFGLGSSIFSVAGWGFAIAPSLLSLYSLSTGVTDPSTVSPVYVAVGQGADNTLAYSNNGTVWFGLGNTLFSTAGYDVAFNGLLFVAVGAGTNSIAWSVTGTNWTGLGTSVFTTGSSVTWTGERWVAVGTGPNSVAWSTDGKSWTGLGSGVVFSTLGKGIAAKTPEIVAVGQGTNTVAYSPDGINFTGLNTLIATAANFTVINAVGSNGSTSSPLWVAGGGTGSDRLAYSVDGFSWTGLGTLVFSSQCTAIAYNKGTNDLWVAVGSVSNTVAWSTNGSNWTGLGTTVFTTQGFGIAYNSAPGSVFTTFSATISNGSGGAGTTLSVTSAVVGTIQVGMGITGTGVSANTVILSGAGSTWTVSISQLVTPAVAMTGSVKRWVAVGQGTRTIATSADGKTWQQVSAAAPFSTIGYGVAYSSALNQWVAVGNYIAGRHCIAYSNDNAASFTGVTSNTIFSTTGRAVAYSDGAGALAKWVAVGQGINSIAYSTDGIAWTGLGITIFSNNGYGVAYSPELNIWVAVGSGTTFTIAYSTNGTAWTGVPSSPIYLVTGNSVAWNGAYFIAGGSSTGSAQVFCYSTDGINWFGYAGYHATLSNAVSYSPSLGVWNSVGSGNASQCYSANGVHWMSCQPSATLFATGQGVAWGSNSSATFIGSINATAMTAAFVTGTITIGAAVTSSPTNSVTANTTVSTFVSNNSASFTGTISGTTLNVVAINSGTITIGMGLTGTGVAANTVILSGSGVTWTVSVSQTVSPAVAIAGLSASWTVNNSQTVASTTMSAATLGRWIALGTPGATSVGYSNDGLVWLISTNPPFAGSGGFDAVYAFSRFVCVGRNTTSNVTIASSTDGITWSSLPNSYNLFQTGRCLAYDSGNNRLVAGGVRTFNIFATNGNTCVFNTGATTTAVFVGSLSGTSLTVTSVISGTLAVGMVITGLGVTTNTVITAGTGSPWTVNNSQTVLSRYLTGTVPSATITGSIATATLNVTASAGTLAIGMGIVGAGVAPGTIIIGGSSPNYTVNFSQTVASTSMSATKSMFIAGGNGGTNNLAYSPDGKNWTGLGTILFSSSAGAGCLGLAYSASLDVWIAVGVYSSASIASSSNNGITWTTVATNTLFTTGYDVVYNTGTNTRFVAVGSGNNSIAYSSTGALGTWTGLGTTMFTNGGRGVAWSPTVGGGRFVAVGLSNQTNGNCIAYSSDGIIWNAVANSGALFSAGCNSVAFGGATGQQKFVAVSSSGNTNQNIFAYSSDGITWYGASGTAITTVASSVFWSTTQNVWLAGTNPTLLNNSYAYSFDGIVWYGGGFTAVGGPFLKFAYGLNTFVAVGTSAQGGNLGYAWEESGNATGDFKWANIGYSALAVSTDYGATWDNVSWGSTLDTCFTTVYNSATGRWIAGSTNNTNVTVMAHSDNGTTWNNFNSGFSTVQWVNRLSKFIAVSNNNLRAFSVIASSTDGIDWTWDNTGTVNNVSLLSGYMVADNSLAPPNGATIVAGRGSSMSVGILSSFLFRLTTGNTWTRQVLLIYSSAIIYAAYDTDPCFMVVRNNFVTRSLDNGVTWTNNVNLSENFNGTNAIWSPLLKRVCLIGNSTTFPVNGVAVSNDGVTWQFQTVNANNWAPVEWSPTYQVFCTLINDTSRNQQQCMISADGLNWYNSNALNTNNTFYGLAWSEELSMFCAVGFQTTLRPYVFVSRLLT